MRGKLAAAIIVVSGLAVLVGAGPALAHHAFAAEFDMTKPVTISGTVSKMQWTNPHAWLYVDVTDKGGKVVTWEVEFGVPNALYRQGFKRTDLVAGAVVTVSGFMSRTSPNIANGVTVTMADGRKLFAGSSAPVNADDKK